MNDADTARPGPARGRTTVAERVVEKIAARAVSEVDNAAGAPPTLLGLQVGTARATSAPRIEATVHDGVVDVRVWMSVRWPESVRGVSAAVRELVTERLRTMTGLRVRSVDIEVPALLTAASGTPVS